MLLRRQSALSPVDNHNEPKCRRRHLQKLESLEVCGGRVTDAGLAHLSCIPSLTSLSLAHNVGITDHGLPLLARLSNLCSLNMTHCKITGPGLTALYGLTVRPASGKMCSWQTATAHFTTFGSANVRCAECWALQLSKFLSLLIRLHLCSRLYQVHSTLPVVVTRYKQSTSNYMQRLTVV